MILTRIVLEGAPASGKTAAFKRMECAAGRDDGTKVVFLPEVATCFFSGMTEDVAGLDCALVRQFYIMQAQRMMEQTAIRAMQNECERLVLICDRGTPDAAVYLSEGLLKMLGCRSDDFVHLYDLCLYMEGARENFTGADDTFRVEGGYDEVMELDQRARAVWKKASDHFVEVPQCPTVEEKVCRVIEEINTFAGDEIVRFKE